MAKSKVILFPLHNMSTLSSSQWHPKRNQRAINPHTYPPVTHRTPSCTSNKNLHPYPDHGHESDE